MVRRTHKASKDEKRGVEIAETVRWDRWITPRPPPLPLLARLALLKEERIKEKEEAENKEALTREERIKEMESVERKEALIR